MLYQHIWLLAKAAEQTFLSAIIHFPLAARSESSPEYHSCKVTLYFPNQTGVYGRFFLLAKKVGSKQAIHHVSCKSKDGSRQSDFPIKILTGLENWFSHTLDRPRLEDKIHAGVAPKIAKIIEIQLKNGDLVTLAGLLFWKDILHFERCVCSSFRWSHLNCFCQRDASPMFMCGNFDKENHEFFFCFFSPSLWLCAFNTYHWRLVVVTFRWVGSLSKLSALSEMGQSPSLFALRHRFHLATVEERVSKKN